MTTLLQAKRAFTETRKAADETYLNLIAASESLDRARSEFELQAAVAAYKLAGIAHDEATERVKEARRTWANLRYGIQQAG